VNVLLLTWDYPPRRGGIQIWMFELARRLPEAQVTVLAPAWAGDRAFDHTAGVRVHRLRGIRLGPAPWLLHLCAATLWACITTRPDLIVCGHVLTAPAALLARRLFGIRYIAFTYAYEIRGTRRQHVVGRLLRNAEIVIACSRFTRTAVLAHGVAEERVRLLYPGVEATRFSSRDGDGSGSEPHVPTILTVARLTELYKGHDTMIRALPVVRARCPNARYVIVGSGRQSDYLARVAQSLGVDDAVVFAGEVGDVELDRLYRSADVVVQVSRESPAGGGAEGFGIVCLEAAACGKPVVAGRSGGLVDAVVDGETGILVDPLDVAAVAEAVVSVLEDAALARRLGEAGHRRVLERFTWDRMAAEARRILGEVARRP